MGKRDFYVQLHLHTSETSRCGRSGGADMARACKAVGYDQIYITDHFMNANIGCDAHLPWPDKVEYLLRGWRAAKAEGDKIGLDVRFGWETFTGGFDNPNGGQELLTYDLGEDFLLANPDLADLSYADYICRVYDAGGKIIHAHPYRRAPYIPDFKPDPLSVEAYEVYNAQNHPENANQLALDEARQYGLLMCAGSDSHHVDSVHLGAMRFSRPLDSMSDLFAALRHGDGEILRAVPADICYRL